MRRIACLLLLLCLLAAVPAQADDTLSFPDMGLAFRIPEGVRMSINTNGANYFYPTNGKTPCLVFRRFSLKEYPDLLAVITKTKQADHPEMVLLQPIADAVIGGFAVRTVTMSYSANEYTLQNVCVTLAHGDDVYLFYTIEVPDKGATVGNLMEDVIAGITWLPSETAAPGKR